MSRGADEGLDGVPRLGAMLGRYRLDAVIGRGGMGVVFRAVDERLDRTVAIKVLAPDLAGDPLTQERFLREARLASSIEHPHIVPVLEAASAGGVDYIAMRFVPGSDLGRVLRREAPLSATRTLAIIEQVADALDAAHARGLVHRDVKPSNVLLEDRDGEWAWLSDFGLTKRMDGSVQLTREGLVGTLEYIAPEAIEHGTLDGRSDQYALGCVAYHCLSGRPPFVAQSEAQLLHAHLHDTPTPISGSDAPPGGIDEVIRRALAKRQADRFPSCRAFATELRRAIEAAPIAGAAVVAAGRSAASGSPAGSTQAGRSGGLAPALAARRWQLVGAMVLAGAVGGSLYLVGQPRPGPGDLALLPSGSARASSTPTIAPSDPAGVAVTARPTATPAATPTPAPPQPETSARPTPGATPVATSLTGPDGVIVFAGKRGSNYDIWAVLPEGGDPVRITDGPADERTPSVSANGSRIVYAVGTSPHRDIWLIDSAAKGRPQRLTRSRADDSAPVISPDGRSIAWVNDQTGWAAIWLMTDDGDGFHEDRAIEISDQDSARGNGSRAPSWFPGGQRIAFQSNDAESTDIWSTQARDVAPRLPWTSDLLVDNQPTVGPDNDIVFASEARRGDAKYLYRIPAREEPRELITRELPNQTDPDYAPDGSRLVVAHGGDLHTMSRNGDELRAVEIANMPTATDPDWVKSVDLP